MSLNKLSEQLKARSISRFGTATLNNSGLKIYPPDNVLLALPSTLVNQAVETALQQIKTSGIAQVTLPLSDTALLYVALDGYENDEYRFRLEIIPQVVTTEPDHNSPRDIDLYSRLLTDLAHDIKNPINSTVLGLDTLARQLMRGLTTPEAAAELIAKLKAESKKPLQILERYQALLATLDSDEIQTHQVINLAEVVSEVLKEVDQIANMDRLELGFGRLTTPDVLSQREKLVFILQELLTNGLVHSPSDSIVRLDIHQNGNKIEIEALNTLRDNTEALDIMFKPFYRGDHAHRVIPARNYGMGLNILTKYVEDLGGNLTISIDPITHTFKALVSLPLITQINLDES